MKTTHLHHDWIAGAQPDTGLGELAYAYRGRQHVYHTEDERVSNQFDDDWGIHVSRPRAHRQGGSSHRRTGFAQ